MTCAVPTGRGKSDRSKSSGDLAARFQAEWVPVSRPESAPTQLATVTMLRPPQNLQPAIEFLDLDMEYVDDDGQSLRALSAISFKAAPGEFMSIVGTSGCGKTTLLKLAAGLVSPTAGDINIFGRPVKGPTQDIGFVFQTAVLLRWRTVLENILLQAEVRKLDMREYEARARKLLDMVGLGGFRGQVPQPALGRHAAARFDLPGSAA